MQKAFEKIIKTARLKVKDYVTTYFLRMRAQCEGLEVRDDYIQKTNAINHDSPTSKEFHLNPL